VICADLQGLVASHYNPDFLGFFMRKQAHIACTTFLPLGRYGVESEKLGSPVLTDKNRKSGRDCICDRVNIKDAHLEKDILILFHRLRVNMFSELDHRLELGIGFFFLPKRHQRWGNQLGV
jgi:hypothetical protein